MIKEVDERGEEKTRRKEEENEEKNVELTLFLLGVGTCFTKLALVRKLVTSNLCYSRFLFGFCCRCFFFDKLLSARYIHTYLRCKCAYIHVCMHVCICIWG